MVDYCTAAQVAYWVPTAATDLGASSDDIVAYAITVASRAVDNECGVPESFFGAGGVTLTDELHDGVDLGYAPGFTSNPYAGQTLQPNLRFNYLPVLSVTTVHELISGAYVLRTALTDYVVLTTGIRYLLNIPAYAYSNIKVTYVAGYAACPGHVSGVTAQLAAALTKAIVISKVSPGTSASLGPMSYSQQGTPGAMSSLADSCFTPSLKADLREYRNLGPLAKVV